MKKARAIVEITGWQIDENYPNEVVMRALERIVGVGDGEIEYRILMSQWTGENDEEVG